MRILTLLVLVALALPAGGAASGSTTFTDATGELANGPDITTVTVSNSDAGDITFEVAIPDRPTLVSRMSVEILVNADNNLNTGSAHHYGAEYLIDYESGNRPELGKWNGTFFDPSGVPQSSLRGSYNGGATISISNDDLGNTRAFTFYADAGQYNARGELEADFAPDGHPDWDWAYTLKLAAPPPKTTTTTATTGTTTPTSKPAAKKKPPKKKKKR